MAELDRLEAEVGRRRAELQAATGRVAHRLRPSRLLDDALARLGPAPDAIERVSTIVQRNPWAAFVLAASAGWLTWQFLRSGNGLIFVRAAPRSEADRLSDLTYSSETKEHYNGNNPASFDQEPGPAH